MIRRVVIYARFSTDKQDARSIDDQARRCRRYAKEHGYTVIEEYSDAAASGGHVERAALKRMLADAKSRPFDAVLVDDQSRLARDLGASITLIFTSLPALRVALVDCATGRASTEKGARTLFAVNAIVNDAFLEMVKHETHRGMEGRAIGGFATGGRTYGYGTVAEDNPTDLDRVRRRYVIDEPEAIVVRRIFREYIEGTAVKAIVHRLNAEGLPAPHDKGRGNKGARGWIPGTINAIVRNERYLGRLTWNAREWIKNPLTGKRNAVARPREQWTTTEQPKLAIVDDLTFAAAQRRTRTNRDTKVARVRRDTMLAGLLRCGVCEGSITCVGGTTKNGKRYRTLGCTAHWSRGSSICPNGLTVSEMKANASLVSELTAVLTDPDFIAEVVTAFTARLSEITSRANATADTERQVATLERQVRQLAENMAMAPMSPALRSLLAERENELAAAHLALSESRPTVRVVPLPGAIRLYVEHIADTLASDDQGRAGRLLRDHLGSVRMTPRGGCYDWTGDFLLGLPTPVKSSSTGVVRSNGSGDRI